MSTRVSATRNVNTEHKKARVSVSARTRRLGADSSCACGVAASVHRRDALTASRGAARALNFSSLRGGHRFCGCERIAISVVRETRSSEASPACASFALSLALPDARAPGASWARAGATSRSMLRCGCGARAARARLAHLLACVRVSLQLLARALGRAASPFGAPRGSAPCLRPRLRAPRRRARSLRIFSLAYSASAYSALHLAYAFQRVSGSRRRF